MPENDTTKPAISAQETPAQAGAGTQAIAAETAPAPAISSATAEPTPAKKWAGKFDNAEALEKGYMELWRHLSKKSDAETLRTALGLWQPEETPTQTTASQTTQAQTQQTQQTAPQPPVQQTQQAVQQNVAQNASVYAKAVAQLVAQGWRHEDAIASVAAHIAEQQAGRIAESKVQEILEAKLRPTMEAMARQYADTLERSWKTDLQAAWNHLVDEFPDADAPQTMTAMRTYFDDQSRKRLKVILEDPSSTIQERVEVLRSAYYAAQSQTKAQVVAQAQAAGAQQEKQRQKAVAAAQVETSGGGGSPTDTDDLVAKKVKALQESIINASLPTA